MEIYFAPIQGFTDYVYRNAHAKYFSGIDKYFTPFLRIEKSEIRRKDVSDLLSSSKFDNPTIELVPQIIGNSREDIEILLKFLKNHGFTSCDLNFGCPFPQQAKKFRGSGIWEKPEMILEVFDTLRFFPEIKFSLKMRIGYSDVSQTLEMVEVINSFPFRFVTIHPRLGKQMYKGDVDILTFTKLSSEISHPIVYNGDIVTTDDIKKIENDFPNLKAVMIGRGLLGNPFLAENYKSQNHDIDFIRLTNFHSEVLNGYLQEYNNSEFMVLDKMKTFWTYAPQSVDKKVLKNIQKSRSLSEYQAFANIAMSKKD